MGSAITQGHVFKCYPVRLTIRHQKANTITSIHPYTHTISDVMGNLGTPISLTLCLCTVEGHWSMTQREDAKLYFGQNVNSCGQV